LITNPPAIFFFRLESGEMAELGLPKGALLVVDRSKNPRANEKYL
jgi:SOS-response transcriptional repressor LexA